MSYNKPLPRINNILWLAKFTGPFPMKNSEIIIVAENWHFSKSLINFLHLFPEDEEFENGLDFVTRCEDLEHIIREERKAPHEMLHSQQD